MEDLPRTTRGGFVMTRKSRCSWLAALLVCLCSLPAVRAAGGLLVRTWRDAGPVSTRFAVDVSNPYGYPETRWVEVSLYFPEDAALNKGEKEYFDVRAMGTAGGGVSVSVSPLFAYHSYRSQYDQSFLSMPYFRFEMYHGGRIKNVPSPAFTGVSVDYGDPDADPFVLSFRDEAFDVEQGIENRYSFEIRRRVFLGKDKLVAGGEVAAGPQGMVRVEITRGCPYTEGAQEYFRKGGKYEIELRVKRIGSSLYEEDWSLPGRYVFKWEVDESAGDDDSSAGEPVRVPANPSMLRLFRRMRLYRRVDELTGDSPR